MFLLQFLMLFMVATSLGASSIPSFGDSALDARTALTDIMVKRAKLDRQIVHGMGWAGFVGYATYRSDQLIGMDQMYSGQLVQVRAGERPTVPNTFIQVMTELPSVDGGRRNGLKVRMPMRQRLAGQPKFGNDRLQGSGETAGLSFGSAYANFVRKGVATDNLVAMNVQNWARGYDDYGDLLAEWWGNWHDMEITRTIYEGFSSNITASTAVKGTGLSKRYPKNFFSWNGASTSLTQIAWSGTASTYRASIIAGLDDSTGVGSNQLNVFDTRTLDKMMKKLPSLNIPRDSQGMYSIMITSGQEETLRLDNRFNEADCRAAARIGDSATMTGEVYRWGRWRIYVNDKAARIAYASGTTLDFVNYSGGVEKVDGLTTDAWLNAQTAGTNQHAACAIVFCGEHVGVYKVNGAGFSVYNGRFPQQGSGMYAAQVLPGQQLFSSPLLADASILGHQDDFGMNMEFGSQDVYGYAAWGYYNTDPNEEDPSSIEDQPFAILATYVD